MKVGWQLQEEGPIFLTVLIVTAIILNYASGLETGQVLAFSLAAAMAVTAVLVIIHSYLRE
jgi:uncharacterized protein (DUF983 family)